MCSHFELNPGCKDLAQRFALKEIPKGYSNGEIRPTDPILGFDHSKAFIKTWGLRVDWNNKVLINARSETVTNKKIFRPFLRSRCIVPATAYFEWRRDRHRRYKNRIFLPRSGLFGIAGITNGQEIIILTCQPDPAIAHIHNRMPVILAEENEMAWINNQLSTLEVLNMIQTNHPLPITSEEKSPSFSDQGELFS